MAVPEACNTQRLIQASHRRSRTSPRPPCGIWSVIALPACASKPKLAGLSCDAQPRRCLLKNSIVRSQASFAAAGRQAAQHVVVEELEGLGSEISHT
jgi:hypothetical protein